jgi:hypothetical protein
MKSMHEGIVEKDTITQVPAGLVIESAHCCIACLRWNFGALFAHNLIVSIAFSLFLCLGVLRLSKTYVSSEPNVPCHGYEKSDPDIF